MSLSSNHTRAPNVFVSTFCRSPPGLSPFRQRAAKNLFRSYIFNGYRRLSGELVYWAIPFALGTSTISHMYHTPSLPLLPQFAEDQHAHNSALPIGYSAYAWAKRYDAWQNSKAAHVAGGHGEH